jgi:predicted amidohydrolase
MRAAAIQLEAVPADVDANLAGCERLANAAGAAGARVIALPEFFTTGIGFLPELAERALPPDGAATELLTALARRHDALVGGSFLCRDGDGEVRNAYLLATPRGIAGRHDKDLPTMWENAFYVGGADDGVIRAGALTVGAAVCWELMRTQTVRRLAGRIDLAMTGSGWWSIPEWPPRPLTRRYERRNAATARRAAESFATYVGAPVVHAAHAGRLRCAMPWMPFRYDGHFEGATVIVAADGTVLASRDWREGEGVVIADVEPGRIPPRARPPERFWLHRRGAVAAATWTYQRFHGRRWYRGHKAG